MDVNRFGASTLYLRAEDGKQVRLLAARKPDDFAEINLGDDNGVQMTFTAGPKLRDIQLMNGKSLHVHVLSDNDGSADITFLGPNEKPVHVLGIDPNGRADTATFRALTASSSLRYLVRKNPKGTLLRTQESQRGTLRKSRGTLRKSRGT